MGSGQIASTVLAGIALVLTTGCLQVNVERCADGRVCPRGTRCLDEPPLCVTPDQLTACVGVDDFADCTVTGVDQGQCYGEVCLPGGCGNLILDPGEACDLGDRDPGNDCSADCLSDETCGNGVVDVAAGEQCDGVELCRPDCSQPLCGDGIHDADVLEQCDAGADNNSSLPNAPCRPSCVLPRCGDGAVDDTFGEVCDDGNSTHGDGCSGDCASFEVCGNQILDFVNGEQCDDGQSNGDGCTATCLVESPTWTERTWGAPPAIFERVTAYDPIRGQVVTFGGRDRFNDFQRDTWVWTGSAWTEVSPPGSPPGRAGHAMVFDGERLIVAGGYNSNDLLDAWAWDGARWSPIASPGAIVRSSHAMTYDAGRDRLVMFGGYGTTGNLDDTWEWDRTTWTQITPTNGSPPARAEHAMAYDPKRGRVVLFGGIGSSDHLDDVWEWDGATWDPITPTGLTPTARRGAVMAYDPGRQQVVMFGGRDDSVLLAETLAWNGVEWSTITSTGPTPRTLTGMAYDLARGELVLHGGDDGSAASTQTWALRGDTWVDLTPSGLLPIVPSSPAAAYDAAHAKIVLFTGSQTWQWDGTSWQREPTLMVGQLNGAALAFDGEHVIHCGGVKFEFGVLTWYSTCRAWSDDAWLVVDVGANFGPARANHAMAFDEARDQVVMFGGRESTVDHGDTWLLTDTGWMASTATGPPARNRHAMVYDRLRQRVVMFGGASGTELFGDTWEWDGATWIDRSGSGAAPSPRASHSMVYDARRRSVILYAGDDGGARDDTWEWNGQSWTLLFPDDAPAARAGASMAYDAARGRSVLFGGSGETGGISDTWQLRYHRSNTPDESCVYGFDSDGDGAIGCSDPDCAGRCERCGDGTCDDGLETERSCPTDCEALLVCGDLFCDPGETTTLCPGDC